MYNDKVGRSHGMIFTRINRLRLRERQPWKQSLSEYVLRCHLTREAYGPKAQDYQLRNSSVPQVLLHRLASLCDEVLDENELDS